MKDKHELIVLAVLVVGAFALRVIGQMDMVFVGDNVWYRGVDSWYHMRLADIVARDITAYPAFDAYGRWPSGTTVGYMPLLAWLVGVTNFFMDYETAAAFIPPILGALTLIPIYFLGRELHSGKVGLFACLLVAALPTEFLHRTLLGFTDHHALEILLMATTTLFLVKAYKTQEWKWRVATGISYGLYQLAWAGVFLWMMIVGVWAFIEVVKLIRWRESVWPLCLTVGVPVVIGALIGFKYSAIETKAIAFGIVLLLGYAWLVSKKRWTLAAIPFGVVALFFIPKFVSDARTFWVPWETMIHLFFWRGSSTVQEMGPVWPVMAMQLYGVSLILAVASIALLSWKRRVSPILVWGIALIVIGICQRRWGYYAAMPIALFASYGVYYMAERVVPAARSAVLVVCAFILLVPSATTIHRVATLPNNINPSYYVAFTWLEKNSPDPFGDSSLYYHPDKQVRPDYGILTWWDYGHWVIRPGRRVPTDSPTQFTGIDARFFASESIEEAERVLNNQNLRYVVIDETLVTSKWYAIARRAKKAGMPVERSMLWYIWTNSSPDYTRIYERGGVKIYEATGQ